METTIYESDIEAEEITLEEIQRACLNLKGFYPSAVREVDSGNENERGWMCFEDADEAETWDKQI